jgi:hypothetical protein
MLGMGRSYHDTMIEEYGAGRLVPGRDLFATYLQQMEARKFCGAKKYEQAFRIYEAIDLPVCSNDPCEMIWVY